MGGIKAFRVQKDSGFNAVGVKRILVLRDLKECEENELEDFPRRMRDNKNTFDPRCNHKYLPICFGVERRFICLLARLYNGLDSC